MKPEQTNKIALYVKNISPFKMKRRIKIRRHGYVEKLPRIAIAYTYLILFMFSFLGTKGKTVQKTLSPYLVGKA